MQMRMMIHMLQLCDSLLRWRTLGDYEGLIHATAWDVVVFVAAAAVVVAGVVGVDETCLFLVSLRTLFEREALSAGCSKYDSSFLRDSQWSILCTR